jgi:hypothetical protein
MKLSVSIPAEDVTFIDEYAAVHGAESRSAVVQRALALLRASELQESYAQAWAEWEDTEADLWEATVADGLTP